jgi:hypothetical protein
MTEQEQIAAEISERYGVPVMAGAFKQCPPSTYTWQIVGEYEAPMRPKDRTALWHKQRAHADRLAKAKAKGPRQPKSVDDMDALGQKMVAMYLAGIGTTEIGRSVGRDPATVRYRLKSVGVFNTNPVKEAAQ